MFDDLIGEMIKTFHISIALGALAVLISYRRPIVHELRNHFEQKVWRGMMWPPLVAVGLLNSSWFLTYAYLTGVEPTSISGLPDRARLLTATCFLLSMIGRWAEAGQHFGQRFAAALAGVGVIFVFVLIWLPSP